MQSSDLDGLLSEEQALVAGTVAELVEAKIRPAHEAIDHAGVHPAPLLAELAELGLFGALVPEELGGPGLGFVGHVVVVEGLARGAGVAGAVAAAQGIVLDALVRGGGAAAGALEVLLGGGLGAPALAEDDACRVATVAEGEGATVRLRGRKALVPFPGRAACYVVRARRGGEDVLVLVDGGAKGVRHEDAAPSLGLRGLECGTLALEAAEGTVLGGNELSGLVIDGARIAVTALLAGIGRGAVEHAVRYAGERKQFGRELLRFTGIQERLALADARTEALRGLCHAAARLRDGGRPHRLAAVRARMLAAELAPRIADDAVQVYGGYGFSREYPVERFYRDACFPGFGERCRSEEVAAASSILG